MVFSVIFIPSITAKLASAVVFCILNLEQDIIKENGVFFALKLLSVAPISCSDGRHDGAVDEAVDEVVDEDVDDVVDEVVDEAADEAVDEVVDEDFDETVDEVELDDTFGFDVVVTAEDFTVEIVEMSFVVIPVELVQEIDDLEAAWWE